MLAEDLALYTLLPSYIDQSSECVLQNHSNAYPKAWHNLTDGITS